jgi:hypothetical protein
VDQARFYVNETLSHMRHRHGDQWQEMVEVSPHDSSEVDPERGWTGGRLFRCVGCDEEVMVGSPTDAAGARD